VLLASGDSEGIVKIWKYAEGKLVKKLDGLGLKSVTALKFNFNNSKIFIGSVNSSILMYGLKSGTT